jgi:hypothetical protein
MADKKPLVFDINKNVQQLQTGDKLPISALLRTDIGSVASDEVTIDNAEICRIIVDSTPIKSGYYRDITLHSNLITVDSNMIGFLALGTNTTGLPMVQSIKYEASERATIRIINVGSQAASNDTDGELILTILIL